MQNFLDDRGTQTAHGAVSTVRAFRDELVFFDREGNIYLSRSDRSELKPGKNLRACMTVGEWSYLHEKCMVFSYERILLDTRFGVMMVFCNLVAATRMLIGVIFPDADRAAAAHLCRESITALTFLSPKMDAFADKQSKCDEYAFAEISELATLYSRAFSTAALQTVLSASLSDATARIAERICLLGYVIGCRVDCRSVREMVPYVADFSGEMFVAMASYLMMLAYEYSPTRSAEVFIGDGDGRLFLVFHVPGPGEEGEIFSNRSYRYEALRLCDELSEYRMFLFECSMRGQGAGRFVSAAFLPRVKQLEYLELKQPLKKLNYSE